MKERFKTFPQLKKRDIRIVGKPVARSFYLKTFQSQCWNKSQFEQIQFRLRHQKQTSN